MSMPFLPNVDINAKTPVERSCNCCDQVSCNFFCCYKKPTSPSTTDKKVDETSKPIIADKKEEKSNVGQNPSNIQK